MNAYNTATISDPAIAIDPLSLDGLLLMLMSLFAATFAIIALRIIVVFALSFFEGFRKFLGYLYLTYTFIWKIAIGLFQFLFLLLILAACYYWFVDELTRIAISKHLEKFAPVTKHVIEKAQGHVTAIQQYNGQFWNARK